MLMEIHTLNQQFVKLISHLLLTWIGHWIQELFKATVVLINSYFLMLNLVIRNQVEDQK